MGRNTPTKKINPLFFTFIFCWECGPGRRENLAVLDYPRAPPYVTNMAVLSKALEVANIVLKKYDPTKVRQVQTGEHSTVTVSNFTSLIISSLKKRVTEFPEILACINNVAEMEKLLEEWAEENSVPGTSGVVPPNLSHLTLNIDTSAKTNDKRYFCTTENELCSEEVSGLYYINKCGFGPQEAIDAARPVVPRYMPRHTLGIHKRINPTTGEKTDFHNAYVPAAWDLWRRNNPDEWKKIPSTCPSDLHEMIKFIIPLEEERKYFYAWTYVSITARSYVYLVLQGKPGVGKNRLQGVLRALHGRTNSVNGKKETFGANGSKFNGQLFNSTLAWFDELKYNVEMENLMKEYQNDTASKELKGQDSTGSSELFCSMCISNNNPRDNYLTFNSRKFSPIILGTKALKLLMPESKISEISNKLDEAHAEFDVKYVAQIAKWLLRVGPGHAAKFERLEYQGPKFWELAHSSMSHWQKIAVSALSSKTSRGYFPGWDDNRKAFQWSVVEAALRRKKDFTDKDYRDATTVMAFFDNYCDTDGKKVFETEAFTGSILQDFWVWPIEGVDSFDAPARIDNGERPKGMSNYQWQKIKKEMKEREENDADLL